MHVYALSDQDMQKLNNAMFFAQIFTRPLKFPPFRPS